MRHFFSLRWLGLVLAGLTMTAAAQTAPKPQEGWHSAFEGYRPFADAPVAPWRESNDTVGRIGGWRAYAREAESAGNAPATAPASGTLPAPTAPTAPSAPPAAGHRH